MNSSGCDPQPEELPAFSFSEQEFCSPCCGCWSFPVFNLLELKHTFPPPTRAVHLPAARFNTFCLWNSAPPLSIASLTAFDHAVTRFTPLSDHSYVILDVRVAHCRHHSLSHALDDCSHDVSICITCNCCPRAASAYPPRYLLEGRLTIAQVEQVNPWYCVL